MKSAGCFACVLGSVAMLGVATVCAEGPGAPQSPVADSLRGQAPGDVRQDNVLKMPLVWCPPGVVKMEMAEARKRVAAKPETEPAVGPDRRPGLAIREPDDDDVVDAAGRNAEAVEPDEPDEEDLLGIDLSRQQATVVTPVKVFLTTGFWLGKFEVTQREWQQLMNTEPWKGQDTTKEGPNFPATYVDWHDATSFCRRLTQREREAGRLPESWGYALPTEAQWERACRARTETRFSFGDDESRIGEYAWVATNTVQAGAAHPHQAGQKKPNPWGLYDMHGNVWEWCRDSYSDRLPGGRDPFVNESGADRVMRGGGICRTAPDCRSSYRNHHTAKWKLFDLGFRVALVSTGR